MFLSSLFKKYKTHESSHLMVNPDSAITASIFELQNN